MKNVQITIKDIAKELKISPSTVSRALKDHPDISKDTKKQVIELAHKLDYQPNSIALSLRKSKTNTLGIIIPRIVHHFFSSIMSGIEDIAHEQGYNIIITQSNESYLRELENIQTLVSNRVDGIFVSIASGTEDFTHLKNLQKRNIPLIFFDRICHEINCNKIVIDDYKGASVAVEHLIEQGCKNIVHLGSPPTLLISQNRFRGYKDTLEKHRIPLSQDLILQCDNRVQGYEQMKNLLSTHTEIDGIFAVNDDTAIGAIKAIKEVGLSIPRDIAVIGFGDNPIAQIVEPQLSSISQPGFEMGKLSAKLLLQQIQAKEAEQDFAPQLKMLETQLVVRESSKRIK